jgi:hypothetical protein
MGTRSVIMGFGIRMYVLLPHLSEQSIVANVHQKGQITKYIILALFFSFFLAWFVGGYIHAKRRLKKGLPLLAYHRVSPQSPMLQHTPNSSTQFLISYSERKRHGQIPQNHFTFYTQPQPYHHNNQMNGQQYAEPPPQYDAPPQYFGPQKPADGQGVEMPMYGQQSGVVGQGQQFGAPQQGFAGPQGQQSGVVGGPQAGQQNGDLEQQLPPRPPQQAKAVLRGFVDRFRK